MFWGVRLQGYVFQGVLFHVKLLEVMCFIINYVKFALTFKMSSTVQSLPLHLKCDFLLKVRPYIKMYPSIQGLPKKVGRSLLNQRAIRACFCCISKQLGLAHCWINKQLGFVPS